MNFFSYLSGGPVTRSKIFGLVSILTIEVIYIRSGLSLPEIPGPISVPKNTISVVVRSRFIQLGFRSTTRESRYPDQTISKTTLHMSIDFRPQHRYGRHYFFHVNKGVTAKQSGCMYNQVYI